MMPRKTPIKIKFPIHSSESGFMIIYTVFMIVIVSAVVALLMFRRSELLQNTTRDTLIDSERSSLDRYAQRSAQQIVTEIIGDAIRSGNSTVGNDEAGSMSGQLRQTRTSDTGDNFFTSSNTSTASQTTLLGVVGVPQFPVSAWSPSVSRWSMQSTPTGLYRVFGDKSQFVGRLTRFSSGLSTTAADRLANRTSTTARGKEISIYEFPVQSFAASGDNIQIASTVVGNVLARNLNLTSAANIQSASIYEGLNLSSGATIGGTSLTANVTGTAGAELTKAFEVGSYSAKIFEDKISLFRGNEFSSLIILGDTTKDAEGIPQVLRRRNGAQNYWDAYTLPYYQCSTRIFVTLSADSTSAFVDVYTSDTSTIAGRIATTSVTSQTITFGSDYYGFSLVSGVGGAIILQFDPLAISSIASVGTANSRAMFVSFTTSGGQYSPSTLGIMPRNVDDLSSLQGFSLVTPNRLYLRSDINWINPVPMSVFAFDVRYGISSTIPSQVTHVGQRAIVGSSTATPIETMQSANGSSVVNKTISLGNITSPSRVPPVTLLGWLVNVRDQ